MQDASQHGDFFPSQQLGTVSRSAITGAAGVEQQPLEQLSAVGGTGCGLSSVFTGFGAQRSSLTEDGILQQLVSDPDSQGAVSSLASTETRGTG